jgi:hypothetical protein
MFPKELTERKQWITWRLGPNGEKLPNGKSNDPSTWCSYEEIKDFDKIAFVFSADDPFVGIDLDDCITEGGVFNDVSGDAFATFYGLAYCERSFSGKGLHLIVRGKKPDWAVCKRGNVECYDHSRFWIMTGDVEYGWEQIYHCQDELEHFLDKYLRKQEPKPKPQVSLAPIVIHRSAIEIIERAKHYVDNCQAAGEGSRNSVGFGISGHLHAMRGLNGEQLDMSDVISMMMLWNERNSPPLEAKEIESLARNARDKGTPREIKSHGIVHSAIDTIANDALVEAMWPSRTIEKANEDEDSDEDFCRAMLPEYGLMREMADYYTQLSLMPTPIMGLAVAVATMEVLLGRKVGSHTDLRTNDYNLVIAQTATGKESCKKAISKVFESAGAKHMLLPPEVQSGNGLISAMAAHPASIWIGDEFGKVLASVLDKKGSQHLKNIAKHLLSFYGESSGRFGGSSHAAGTKNEIDQPHLVILGLTTGATMFENITEGQVQDGLIGRIAFWPVQERPKPVRKYRAPAVPESLTASVSSWVNFDPGAIATAWDGSFSQSGGVSFGDITPKVHLMPITEDAETRYDDHRFAILDRMEKEPALRAALWGRTAARSLLLALCHRCSRMASPAEVASAAVESQDINWGIKLSNWLARIACELVEQNVVDKSVLLAKRVLEQLSAIDPRVSSREALRRCRTLTAGDLDAAAETLGYKIEFEPGKRKPRKFYRKTASQ